jgi:pimeloyl-ACP methyl ester carboxylesterase
VTGGFPDDERQESVTFVTSADGVRLRTVHLPCAGPGDVGVVLVPGFSCSWDKPFVRRVARWLTPYAGVVVLDLRGQGQSGGLSTLGNLEALDVDAAVAQARALGYARVVTVGFSMGGAAVLRQAGLHGELTAERVDAVVSISAASRWWRLETRRMRNLARLTTTRPGRGVARALMRTRIDPRARYGVAAAPVEVVGRIAPVPLLVVHGSRDAYLTDDNAVELHAAAGEPRALWLWPTYGHAELALDREQTDRIGAQLEVLLAASPDATMGPP